MAVSQRLGKLYSCEVALMSGFSDDVSNLLDKVLQRPLGFQEFAQAWREMEFSLVKVFL
jgi:hypothetical protein